MSVVGGDCQLENHKLMFQVPAGYRMSTAGDDAWEVRTALVAVAAGLVETALSLMVCGFGDRVTGYQ